jgi:hypothetical protein
VLLFGLEPLFVKMALPLFGGSPTVWNTAFAFFTAVLFLGYLYAHALVRLTPRRQMLVHAIVLLAAASALPVGAGDAAPAGPPALAALVVLTERIGLPFFALAATTPLLQAWLAAAGARDSYRLYAASNLASVVVLLAYPFAIEPYAGLTLQSRAWSAGYVAFAALMIALAFGAARGRNAAERGAGPRTGEASWRRRALWLALAGVPVMLVTGLTAHLSYEVAPIPFVWTLPLAAYVLAFALAFAPLRASWAESAGRLVPFAVVPVVVLLALHATLALPAYAGLTLAMLFLLALALDVRLWSSRPPQERLTEFALWIAAGGALGGILGVVVAPLAFTNVGEYPLAIALACLLLPARAPLAGNLAAGRVADVALPVALVACVGLSTHFAPLEGADRGASTALWLALGAGIATAFARRPVRLAVAVGSLLLLGTLVPDPNGVVIARERNFFGPKRVFADPGGGYHFLLSGGTVHGVQASTRRARRSRWAITPRAGRSATPSAPRATGSRTAGSRSSGSGSGRPPATASRASRGRSTRSIPPSSRSRAIRGCSRSSRTALPMRGSCSATPGSRSRARPRRRSRSSSSTRTTPITSPCISSTGKRCASI